MLSMAMENNWLYLKSPPSLPAEDKKQGLHSVYASLSLTPSLSAKSNAAVPEEEARIAAAQEK